MPQDSRDKVKLALKIGLFCDLVYLVKYIFQNLLSVYTPGMLETGFITKESAALYSSVYMVSYAAGQLFAGILGDYVRPKYMAAAGLAVAGTGLLLFPLFPAKAAAAAFVMLGAGLSALRGPFVKFISERLEPEYARLASNGLLLVAYVGPLAAAFFALFLGWKTAFVVSSLFAYACALVSFIAFGRFENAAPVKKRAFSLKDVAGIFKIESFVPYLFIGMVVETLISSVGFWTPTYFADCLGFSSDQAGLLFSAVSVVRALSTVSCLALYKLFRENSLLLGFSCFVPAAVLFLLMRLVSSPAANVAVFLLAQAFASVAGATLWSIYIPSLGKSGRASSASGIIDCMGYFASACTNMISPLFMERSGWHGVLALWSAVAAAGALLSVCGMADRKKRGRE